MTGDLANPAEATAATELLALDTLERETFAEMMPQVFLSLLERRYLADFEPARWEVSPTPDDSARPLLREVLVLGRPLPGEDWSQAMPHVLTASHTMGQAVVMILHGNGQRHRIFLGGRRIANAAHGSTQDFLEAQASGLRANVTGLQLSEPARLDGKALPELSALLQEAPALAVITGIPAPRGRTRTPSPFQSLDRLISAVGTHRYALAVIAEPLDPRDLDETLDRCRRLQGDVHALVRHTIQESRGEQTSEPKAETEGDDQAASSLPTYLSYGLQGLALFCQLAGLFTPVGQAAEVTRWVGHAIRANRLVQPSLSAAGLVSSLWGSSSGAPVQKSMSQTRSRSVSTELLDANARACEELLTQHIDRLQEARSNGWWRTAVYVAAESDAALETVIGALHSICSGQASALDPLRELRLPPWQVRSAAIHGQVLRLLPAAGDQRHPLGPSYDALATCMSSDELSALINLPRRDIPGLSMREVGEFALSAASSAEPAVRLGSVLDSSGRLLDPVTVTAHALNRHVFVTGMTGYGKTTTAKRILRDSYRQLDVPFLVIEPVKSEYRDLADSPELRGRIAVYAIGEQAPPGGRRSPAAAPVLPFRMNPFMPIESVPLARHIDLLKAVFNAAFPMFAGMSYVLEEAILEVYQERGWNLHTSSNDVLGSLPKDDDLSALVPSIGDLHDKIDQVLERRQYGREVHQNMGAALRSRLRSLMVGAKGMALDTRRSVPADQLFSRPCVIELRNLGDDEEKSFVMALLLCQLYEFAEARRAALPAGQDKLAHLTLIEEAHRLLRASRSSGPESPDAQAKAVTLFTDMLAEMRAYGEGFVVVDQIPTKLAPDVLKNSNIKILHRLVAPDDRSAAGSTINLTDAQIRYLANLPPGVAVVHDEGIGSPVLMRVDRQDPEYTEAPGEAAPAGDGQPQARSHDLTYLYRNAGCRYCPAPCDFLHLTGADILATWLDTTLEPFFACLLLGSADDAWKLWAEWRTAFQQRRPVDGMSRSVAAGVMYCASSQAGHRWLGRTLVARRKATGVKGWAPEDRLDQDRAAHHIGRFCHAWLESTGLDDPGRAAFMAAQSALRALIAASPPRELPGCASCPSPCLMLPVVAPILPEVAQTIAARVTATTAMPTRLRSLASVTEPITNRIEAQLGSPIDRAALLHCLITTSCATSADADPAEVLSALPLLDAPPQ
jgi:DNA helicase HerA-like ATPase